MIKLYPFFNPFFMMDSDFEDTFKCDTIDGRINSVIRVADNKGNKIDMGLHYGHYYINNVEVDRKTYLKAKEVYAAGGKIEAVANSINDILDEYNENKALDTKKSKALDDEIARSKRIQELRKSIVAARKELDELYKKD